MSCRRRLSISPGMSRDNLIANREAIAFAAAAQDSKENKVFKVTEEITACHSCGALHKARHGPTM